MTCFFFRGLTVASVAHWYQVHQPPTHAAAAVRANTRPTHRVLSVRHRVLSVDRQEKFSIQSIAGFTQAFLSCDTLSGGTLAAFAFL